MLRDTLNQTSFNLTFDTFGLYEEEQFYVFFISLSKSETPERL